MLLETDYIFLHFLHLFPTVQLPNVAPSFLQMDVHLGIS